MFAVIETCQEGKNFIGFVNSLKDCEKFTKKQIGIHDYSFLSNISPQEIKNNTSFKPGKYLIEEKNEIFYLEKFTKINKGYLYNSEDIEIKILCSWELIDNKEEQIDIFEYEPLIITENDKSFILEKSEPIEINYKKKIKDFNLINIQESMNIGIIGKRCTGKTTLVKKILDKYNKDFISNSLIICSDEYNAKMYKNKYPDAKVINGYSIDIIWEYLVRNKGAIVLEESFGIKKSIDDFAIQELFYNSKNYNKLFIIVTQNPFQFKPEYRSNLDYVFLFRDDFEATKSNLYSLYFNKIFETCDEFNKIFLEVTENNSIMVLENSKKEIYKFNTMDN